MKLLKAKPLFYPLIVSIVIGLMFGLFWWLVDDQHIPVLMPSGQIASEQQQLILFTVILSAVVVIPVFIMLVAFAFQFREGNKKAEYKPEWDDNKWLEVIWWGIPILIILLLSVVTYLTSHSLDPYKKIDSDKSALEVQVVALQWKWLFLYPEQGVATVNQLTIPTNRPVHFSLSADAPMSAFWIPALGSQIYSMNGMTSQLNLIANQHGSYKGYNTNINGEGYSEMTFDVEAVSEDDFSSWVNKHSRSQNLLDQARLKELTAPSVVDAPIFMGLKDKHLYNSVIMKYMNQDVNQRPANSEQNAPEPLDEPFDKNKSKHEGHH